MSVVVRTAQDVASNVGARIEHTTNRLLPPEQRERALESLRAFSVRNPKIASFLAAQTALAGLPILLFLVFAAATLIVSLFTFVLLGVIAALVFTLFTTGFALLLVVPIVFIGSCTASIAFVWGLIGYIVLQRLNGGETPVQPGTKVGDSLNALTGGRLRDLVDRDGSDAQQEQLAIDSSQDKNVPLEGQGRRGDHEARSGSSRRRYDRQSNGTCHGGEVGEESQEGGARGTAIGTRDHPEAHITTYGPVDESVVDWKTQFQREGIVA
ncbi:uncharacterized protein M421DRAFT_415974 [Didymella exigua CBS 183.55]|uniref:Uncharacterized protein n=1 Tax=Didymella exigua CBS 183.55 TaxID=1150837 RepID=A0A6A5S7Y2_9PLEO|nr:uncharacterized protein M421DRAFT_415974 [Didymella exigua CBS 183.55]KAF1933627.1 hypothetical protein M421DRAFT_415974 [Didymella exigua CBS 183.55]